LSHNGQSQKTKNISPQRRREKHFIIVNRAAGAVNNKLAFPPCLCGNSSIFNVSSWLEAVFLAIVDLVQSNIFGMNMY